MYLANSKIAYYTTTIRTIMRSLMAKLACRMLTEVTNLRELTKKNEYHQLNLIAG